MKRLVDSSSSEFSRSLLRAGIEERPPVQGRLKLLVSLGLIGGISLATSKAVAWFATTTGKLTAIAAGVAITGGATFYASSESRAVPTPRVRATQRVAPLPSSSSSLPEPVPGASTAFEFDSSAAETNFGLDADTAKPAKAFQAALPEVKRSPARRRRSRRRADKVFSEKAAVPLPAAQQAPSLEEEVRLVDEIRLAIESHSGAHEALVERYWRTYPQGQLAVEVRRLSASEK